MNLRRGICVIALLLSSAAIAHGQATKSAAPERFPYRFSNFVWWSDADLRAQLHKRLPKLGETIARNSPEERQIHDALVVLLKKKGIVAEVQSVEPQDGWEKLQFAPGAPPQGIVFGVLPPPEIVVSTVDAPPELNAIAQRLHGRPYGSDAFWQEQEEMAQVFRDEGNLAAKVRMDPGAPTHEGKQWSVPLIIAVDKGPVFHVGTVKVDGGPLLEGRSLQRFVAVHPGELARGNALGRLGLMVGTFYHQHGYEDVRVQAEPELDREHGLANYFFRTDPGPQYRVGKITVEGLNAAQEGEVREMLALAEGDIFDLSKVEGIYRAMKSSPGLLGEAFSFSYVKDRAKGVVSLKLEFRKAGS